MDISVVLSNKGKNKLFIDGYDYHYHSKSKKNEYRWLCCKRKTLLCKSFVITIESEGKHEVKIMPSDHNHDSCAHKKEVCVTNNKLKEQAKISQEILPSQIIRNAIVNCESTCRSYLPNKHAQKMKIARIRRKEEYKSEPNNLEEIEIPENIKFLEGELFVLNEKHFNGECNIILGTATSLAALSRAKCWFMDGTFYVVPTIMRQLFTIHGQIDKQVFPLVFCIMSKKSKEAYQEFFYELCKLAVENRIELCPTRIITDFEKTIHSAGKSFFPSAQYKGCLFHFGQNIWRKVQKSGVARKYGVSEEFSIQVRMLKSLAFVPAADISNYFEEFRKNLADKDLKKMCVWFKENYIGNKNKTPRYCPEFWSIGDTAENNFPRTNNNVEAWHRRLKAIVGRKKTLEYTV